MSNKTKTVCNRENGSRSSLWGRNCWIADSLLSLLQSHIETLTENRCDQFGAQNNPDHPLWKLAKDLDYYCEELRVKNGLRSPSVLNRDEEFPEEINVV